MTTDTKFRQTNSADSERTSLPHRSAVLVGVLCLPVIAVWAFGGSNSPKVSVMTQSMQPISPVSFSTNKPHETPAQAAATSDETYRQLIVGNWETDRDGKRYLTVSDDGTAVMNVDISGNWSLLFGEKMKFNIVWSIEDGVLTFETTGGEPKRKVDLITSMYGSKRVQRIKILDESTLRLPDEDPQSEDHIWTRVGSAGSQSL